MNIKSNNAHIRINLVHELTHLIIEQVKKYKKSLDTRGRKQIFLYEDIIKIFLTKLETNLTYTRLSSIYGISKSHIHNIFNKWTIYGVFKNAYTKFLKKYSLYINNDEAYIDTTTILNKYGYINTVGYNSFESKKHKCNKL